MDEFISFCLIHDVTIFDILGYEHYSEESELYIHPIWEYDPVSLFSGPWGKSE